MDHQNIFDTLDMALNDTSFFKRLLSRPDRFSFPLKIQELTQLIERVRGKLPYDEMRLFDLRLVTHILLNNREPALINWAKRNIDVSLKLNSHLKWESVEKGKWTCAFVPVVLPSPLAPSILTIVVGISEEHMDCYPKWCENIFSQRTLRSLVSIASKVLKETGFKGSFYFYPLINEKSKIEGSSFFLGVLIALLSLAYNEPLNKRICATGSVKIIQDEVVVLDVAGIKEKYRIACLEKFELMIIPWGNRSTIFDSVNGPVVVPVKTLFDAWMWINLYTGENYDKVKKMELVIDPSTFCDNFYKVDLDCLKWFLNTERGKSVIKEVFNQKEQGEVLLNLVGGCLRNNIHMAETILDVEVDVDKIVRVNPKNGFFWSAYKFKLATKHGQIEAARKWANVAEDYLNYVTVENKREVISFINSKFVHERHNRFIFNPDIPEKVGEWINKLKPMEPDIDLGKLYGTVAQNYGFCGPEYLDKTKKYVKLAQINFGDGKIEDEKLKVEWQREFSYLAYAYLDAGCFDKARYAMLSFLGLKELEELSKKYIEDIKLTPYQLTLLVRYLADTIKFTESQKTYFEIKDFLLDCLEKALKEASFHPWELFAFNLGRILLYTDNKKQAKLALGISLDICMNGGETLFALGLLPLCEFFINGIYTPIEHKKKIAIVDRLNKSSFLNLTHFYDLLCTKDDDEFFEVLCNNLRRFFPFSYR